MSCATLSLCPTNTGGNNNNNSILITHIITSNYHFSFQEPVIAVDLISRKIMKRDHCFNVIAMRKHFYYSVSLYFLSVVCIDAYFASLYYTLIIFTTFHC